MSPEQAAGDRELDGRCDVYALACVIYEMLAGAPPFSGDSARAIVAKHLSEPPTPLRARRPDAPAAVEQALARALAKDPADRFATIAEFTTALEETRPGAVPSLVGKTRSIAVLPFVNASADPDNEYLSDGISDELINALTKVEGLRIASRTSVFALKGKPQDIRAIGALLGVSVVLEGTVRKSGDRLRITVQLSAAEDGRNSGRSATDRKLDDVFVVQDEIARTIVSTLRTTFLADIADPTPQRYTHNLEAYSLYLKGRYCLEQAQSGGRAGAISFFKQAIDYDSGYALAYSGLSDSYALQVDYRSVPSPRGIGSRENTPSRRSTGRHPARSAHVARLGAARIRLELAGRDARVRPSPGPESGLCHGASLVLIRAAREWAGGAGDDGSADGARARPVVALVRRGVGWISYYTRRYEQALYHLRRAVAMNPTSEDTYRVMAWCSRNRGPTPRRSVRSARRSPSHPTCRTRPRAWPTCWP